MATPKGGEREEMQVAVQVASGVVTLRELSREIAARTSLGRGDVLSTIATLVDVAGDYLTEGYIVELEELGRLQPRLSARAIPMGEEYTAERIEGLNVRLLPGKGLKERLKTAKYRRIKE